MTDPDGTDGREAYRGLLGALRYAPRASDSLLFRSYALVGGVAAALVAIVFALGLVVLIAGTTGGSGGSLTLSRAFFVVVAMFVVAPLLAPILLVARRHRHGRAVPDAARRYDAALALAGYVFLASLYVGLVVSVPPAYREPASGAVAALYALPAVAGVIPPLLGVAGIWLAHRLAG